MRLRPHPASILRCARPGLSQGLLWRMCGPVKGWGSPFAVAAPSGLYSPLSPPGPFAKGASVADVWSSEGLGESLYSCGPIRPLFSAVPAWARRRGFCGGHVVQGGARGSPFAVEAPIPLFSTVPAWARRRGLCGGCVVHGAPFPRHDRDPIPGAYVSG